MKAEPTTAKIKKYGFFLTTTNIVGTLANNIDKILIGIIMGPARLAIYSIAIAIPIKLKDLLRLGAVPLTPKVNRDGIELSHVEEKIKGFILPLALIVAGGLLLYWFFIDDIMLLMFGVGYQESGEYAKLLLPLVLLRLPTSLLGTFTMMKKKTRAIVLGYHVFPFIKLDIMSVSMYY
ncbi:lipopolysaccharide biosynthesis protein [Chloroflexota bacterium]